jgi:Tfp pilus assembly protein PilX
MKNHYFFHSQKGFTLLMAALVASIALSLGAAIFNIAHKQVNLSSLGRDSQFAFYAADMATECALYWDVRVQYWSSSTPPTSVTCENQVASTTFAYAAPTSTFTFQYQPNGGLMQTCASVTVTKVWNASTQSIRTVIHGDGFNEPCNLISTSAQSLQRSVELNY